MKFGYDAFKSSVAAMLGRSTHELDCELSNGEVRIVSGHTSYINKKALSIAHTDRLSNGGVRQYCVTGIGSPVTKEDSQLNRKALRLRD